MEEPESRVITVSSVEQVVDLTETWVEIASDLDGIQYQPTDCPIDIILIDYFDEWMLEVKARRVGKPPTILCLQVPTQGVSEAMKLNMEACRKDLVELLEEL